MRDRMALIVALILAYGTLSRASDNAATRSEFSAAFRLLACQPSELVERQIGTTPPPNHETLVGATEHAVTWFHKY